MTRPAVWPVRPSPSSEACGGMWGKTNGATTIATLPSFSPRDGGGANPAPHPRTVALEIHAYNPKLPLQAGNRWRLQHCIALTRRLHQKLSPDPRVRVRSDGIASHEA